MKAVVTTAEQLQASGRRLDGSYHASDGVKALRFVRQWAGLPPIPAAPKAGRVVERTLSYGSRRLDTLGEVCVSDGIFIPSRFKRIFVDDPEHGAPYLTGGSIMQADPLRGAKLLSYRFTRNMDKLVLRERMILVTCSGTIGNSAYVNANFKGAVGSPDLLRIVADSTKIPPGYLYAFLSSSMGKAIIEQKTYGAVVPHIEAHHMVDLPIPRLDPATEQRIHELVERAASLRVSANQKLKRVYERFEHEVLGISAWKWRCDNEHAYTVGIAKLDSKHYRLDAFHYVGYVHEAVSILKTSSYLGELIEPYQPPIFKRPYTGETGIPFLSGMDLYNSYPKPRMYISRQMKNLERYIVEAGTILVQNVGQRYGLFGRPTILPKHLDQVAVTQHLMRVYVKDPRDRGFVYVWLSTEFGRRLLLKQSFGTSMGVLFEHSFNEMPVPACSSELRFSFETEISEICEQRETANELEDQAQALLVEALELSKTTQPEAQ